jgi:hypothetical protein
VLSVVNNPGQDRRMTRRMVMSVVAILLFAVT